MDVLDVWNSLSLVRRAATTSGQRGDPPRAAQLGTRLVLLAVAVQTTVHLVNRFSVESDLLDVNEERTPFSLLSALIIGTAALGAFLAARAGRVPRWEGRLLGAALAFLAVDEFFVVHERVAWHAVQMIGLSGDWDSVIWPMVYVPLLGAVALMLVRAARPPGPAEARASLVVGLGLLASAVVLEVLSAPFSTSATADGVVHALEGAVEEACEIAGWGLIATGLWVLVSARSSATAAHSSAE